MILTKRFELKRGNKVEAIDVYGNKKEVKFVSAVSDVLGEEILLIADMICSERDTLDELMSNVPCPRRVFVGSKER